MQRAARTDRIRSVCLGVSAGAVILVPTIGPLIAGTEEGAEEYDTDITPPDYAFTIWGPIFALTAANAVQHALNPSASINQRSGWWLSGAYTANTAWSIAAQSGRFRYTPFILPLAAALAGIAYSRTQGPSPRGGERLVSHSSGLLFGWISVASLVNIFAVQKGGTFAPTSRPGRTAARVGIACAAPALSAIIARSRHGYGSVSAAGIWALGTNAANSQRTFRTRQISAAGAVLIAATTAGKLLRGRKSAVKRFPGRTAW